jgi:hypothetical protein
LRRHVFLDRPVLATDPTFEPSAFNIPALPDPCEDAEVLAVKAERCRRLAAGISDRQTSDVLLRMAENYEQAAERLTTAATQD